MFKKLSLMVMLMLIAAACSNDAAVDEVATTVAAPVSTEAPTTTQADAGEGEMDTADHSMLGVSESALGDIVTDGAEMTLYAFVPDAQGDPTCVEGCVDSWPLVTVPVVAGEGVDTDLLGSVTHPNGEQQATFNGWPVYYFAGDAAVGDTNGQGLKDAWYVISPDGELIGAPEMDAMGLSLTAVASDLGDLLADSEGSTVYLFLPDAQGAATCQGGCLDNWPIVPADVVAGDGLDGALLGSVTHPNGTEQATVNGWPLYYFAGDAAGGDTNGQGLNDVWYVVSPGGDQLGG